MAERTDTMSGGPATGAHRRSVDEIERDIEHTQREMSRTISTIQHRLSPDHMKAKAKVHMRETSRGMMDRVKSHPAGVALIGLGAWMLTRNNESEPERYAANYAYDDFHTIGCGVCGATFEESERGWSDRVRDGASTAGERVRGAAESVRESAAHAAHRTAETTSSAAHRVTETGSRVAHSTGERARRIGRSTGTRARTLARTTGRSYEENPFILGGVGLILGALLGAAIPETEREHELMGPARDRALEKAREAAHERAEQVRHVAGAAKDAAIREGKNEARREGLVDDSPESRITTP